MKILWDDCPAAVATAIRRRQALGRPLRLAQGHRGVKSGSSLQLSPVSFSRLPLSLNLYLASEVCFGVCCGEVSRPPSRRTGGSGLPTPPHVRYRNAPTLPTCSGLHRARERCLHSQSAQRTFPGSP